MTRTVRAGGHDILIGPLAAGLERLSDHPGPLPLVSDERVLALHGGVIRDGLDVAPIVVPEGEAAKSWPVLESLLARLAQLDVSRATPIIALGGGSVGDVAGLAASLFKRGCPIVQIPTTLLAQADSSIGGKTAIDFAGAKNLVGAFHPPVLVMADPSLLATLDPRQLRAGYAEVVKYGLIDDPAFFGWCEANAAPLLAGHRDLLTQAIEHCAAAKARIVAGDLEDRSGRRALLNLGHSFAHAIEAEAGIGRLLHGEAVGIGLVMAHRFSVRLGLSPSGDADRIERHLASTCLPTRLADAGVSGPSLLRRMSGDKKNPPGRIALVLSHGIGRAFLDRSAPVEALAAFLADSA